MHPFRYMAALSARFAALLPRAVPLLLVTILSVVYAVADATPLESLYIRGIYDGGDYDSLVQPLVLLLSGVPDSQAPRLVPLGDNPDRIQPFGPASLPDLTVSSANSRAPPAR